MRVSLKTILFCVEEVSLDTDVLIAQDTKRLPIREIGVSFGVSGFIGQPPGRFPDLNPWIQNHPDAASMKRAKRDVKKEEKEKKEKKAPCIREGPDANPSVAVSLYPQKHLMNKKCSRGF